MKRFKKAFTMTELVIVLAVIAILAAILIPVFSSVVKDANAKSALSDARNIATQYVMDTFGVKNAPEQMVIAVYKGGQFWLYGYDRDSSTNDNRLMISDMNPYNYDDFKRLTDDWSFNSKHDGEDPANYLDGTTEVVPERDGTFWLVPYNDANKKIYDVRSSVLREEEAVPYAEENYLMLNADGGMTTSDTANGSEGYTSTFGKEGEVLAYHGILLPGTYETDSRPVGDSGGSGIIEETPAGGDTLTLSFSAGEQEGNLNIRLPESVSITENSWVIPSNYSASDVTGEYEFTGWQRTAAFQMVSDAVLIAQWTRTETHTVTFERSGGDLFVATGTPGFVAENFITDADGNVSIELERGKEIATLVADSYATKEGNDFVGWMCRGTLYTRENINNISVNADMTFTAVFAESDVTVTIDPNNGGVDATSTQNVAVGATINLPEADGYTAPEGKVFGYWTSSVAEDTQHYAAGAENIVILEDTTFTANWTDSGFTVEYMTTIPAKAQTAGITATVPENTEHSAGTGTIEIGGAVLEWYDVTDYSIAMPDGSVVPNKAEGDLLNTASITSGTITITPNYTAKRVTVRYVSGGYTIPETLPETAVYDLVDIKDDFKVSTYQLTCEENFQFLGWVDMDDASTLTNWYVPGATYDMDRITESLGGRTITFLAMFDETTVLTKSITFKYWDYQNYNNPDDNVFGTRTFDIPVGSTISEMIFFDGTTPINMPDMTPANATVTAKNGTAYASYYCFAYEAIYTPTYAGVTGTPAFTDFTVTEETADGTVVNIPTYRMIDKGTETGFVVVTTSAGWVNIDRGSTVIDESTYNISLGGNYVLGNDITLTADNTHPIGYTGIDFPGTTNYRFDFEGIFDGFGYLVTGWGFNSGSSSDNRNVGMFSCNQGTIRNLKVSMTKIISARSCVAVIAGENYGTIENIVVEYAAGGCIIEGQNRIGTIAGMNMGTLRNCHVYATLASAYHLNSVLSEDVTFTGPENSYEIGIEKVVSIGAIAGSNDGGTITLCSVGSNAARLGVNCSAANSDYTSIGIGGIAGTSVMGTIDQCWTYCVDLNRNITEGTVADIQALQAVGGIAGLQYGGIVQHCWTIGDQMTVGTAGGGIVGMLTSSGTLTDCWARFGGALTGAANYVGDIVSTNSKGSSCNVTNCAIWSALYTGTVPEGATAYDTLSGVEPAAIGMNSSVFMTHSNGPMLINNVFAASWNF